MAESQTSRAPAGRERIVSSSRSAMARQSASSPVARPSRSARASMATALIPCHRFCSGAAVKRAR